MKKIFIFFALFFAFSVNLFAQSAITKSDYQIYAEVLRDIRRNDMEINKVKFSFVIADTTYANPDFVGDYKEKKYRGLNRDFKRKNRSPQTFKKFFPVKYEYDLITESEFERLLSEGGKDVGRLKKEEEKSKIIQLRIGWGDVEWKYFTEKYPNANGCYKFSAIGYSLNKRFAVVTTEGEGAFWSSNTHYLFEKIGGKWTIVQSGGGYSVA